MADYELERFRKCFQPRQWFSNNGEPDPITDIFTEEDALMWVYRFVGGTYQVGFFLPDGTWNIEGTFESKDDAAERVNYLNGGKK